MGNREFLVRDPYGCLPRFFLDLGLRSLSQTSSSIKN